MSDKLLSVTGYWLDDPECVVSVLVARDESGGEDDDDVFHYMCGMPLHAGDIISDDFFVLSMENA